MNVMYLCDDNYAMIAGVSILSLMENNRDMEAINIFLVSDGISDCNIEKIKLCVKQYNRNLVILEKPDIKSLLGCNVEMHWWIENVFSRVFLGEVFKDYREVRRLIYIDCDTLIVGSLQDLWDMDLGGRTGAGVCEAMGNIHKKVIGLSKEDNYFNAGMFLIDLNKWREADVDAKASEFVNRKNGRLEYADESVLNGVLSKELKRVSPKYNLTSLSFYFTADELKIYRKSYINYSENERQEALADGRIIHFTSTYLDVRPWVEGCHHPYTDQWLDYKNKSLWAEKPLMPDNRSRKKKLARALALAMPKCLRLPVTGFMHAYVKPCRYVFGR